MASFIQEIIVKSGESSLRRYILHKAVPQQQNAKIVRVFTSTVTSKTGLPVYCPKAPDFSFEFAFLQRALSLHLYLGEQEGPSSQGEFAVNLLLILWGSQYRNSHNSSQKEIRKIPRRHLWLWFVFILTSKMLTMVAQSVFFLGFMFMCSKANKYWVHLVCLIRHEDTDFALKMFTFLKNKNYVNENWRNTLSSEILWSRNSDFVKKKNPYASNLFGVATPLFLHTIGSFHATN